jgi:hypothetical protein
MSAQQRAGPDRAVASLPFPLPTYATDVPLSGICIFRRQRIRAIELLNIGLVVLWREHCPLPKVVTPGDEFLQLLWSVHGHRGAVGRRGASSAGRVLLKLGKKVD